MRPIYHLPSGVVAPMSSAPPATEAAIGSGVSDSRDCLYRPQASFRCWATRSLPSAVQPCTASSLSSKVKCLVLRRPFPPASRSATYEVRKPENPVNANRLSSFVTLLLVTQKLGQFVNRLGPSR